MINLHYMKLIVIFVLILPLHADRSLEDKTNKILQKLEIQTQYILHNRPKMKYSQFVEYYNKVVELENIVLSYKGTDKKWLADKYGTLAWYQNLASDFFKAIQSAKKGIELDSSQTWIYKNLAHAYLFSGNRELARKIYIEKMDTMISDAQISWKEAVLEDFDFFVKFEVRYDLFDEVYRIFKSN